MTLPGNLTKKQCITEVADELSKQGDPHFFDLTDFDGNALNFTKLEEFVHKCTSKPRMYITGKFDNLASYIMRNDWKIPIYGPADSGFTIIYQNEFLLLSFVSWSHKTPLFV